MTKLPRGLSGNEVIKALGKVGFRVRRRKGSHVILRRNEPFAQVVVPDHDVVDTGTLSSIIDGAGLNVEEFVSLLK